MHHPPYLGVLEILGDDLVIAVSSYCSQVECGAKHHGLPQASEVLHAGVLSLSSNHPQQHWIGTV